MLSKYATFFLLLLSAVLPLSAATVQYNARQDIATGAQHLTGLAIADFNHDGKPDIAVTDDFSQTILVYLNNGDGTFSAPVTTTLTVPGIGGLGALVSGDVNEDGKQDLLVAPVGGNQVGIVLLGNGDGTFTQGPFVSGSYGFLSATLVDINGDSHLDLVSAQNGNTYVALGDGKGNFLQQQVTGPSDTHFGLAVADFNGDKHLDFVTTDYTNASLTLYPGNGDGSFGTPTEITSPILSHPESVVAADFRGIGKQDLLVSEPDIALLLSGNGDGTFQTDPNQMPPILLAPVTNSSQGISPIIAVGDVDGDGHPDIVAADDGSDMLSVLLNDGSGNFPTAAPTFTAPLDFGSGVVQLADLNGDGLPDIVVGNYKTGHLSIFLSIVPKLNSTVTVQSSQLQALVGSSVTVSVQVAGSGSTPPTGAVTLASGTTSFGQQMLSTSGVATFTLPGLAVGQYPLTATYAGDGIYKSAANSTVTQSITDVQVSLPTTTETIPAGSSATFPISVAALAGFSGSVMLSCDGLPSGYACSPPVATLSASSSTINLIVSPPATLGYLDGKPLAPSNERPFALLACLGLVFWAGRGKQRLRGILLSFCFVCLIPFTGCSGGGPSKPAAYTGTSNFTVTVTATQGTITSKHQLTATLIVQ